MVRPDSKTYHDQHITFVYNWQIKHHHWCNWQVVQTSLGVYLCQKTIFWILNVNVYVSVIIRKIKWFLLTDQSDLEISGLCSCQLDWSVQIKFGLRPDIWSDLEEFCTDLENKTECLLSLKKICKLGLRTKFGLGTKSDLFYQVTQCKRATSRCYKTAANIKTTYMLFWNFGKYFFAWWIQNKELLHKQHITGHYTTSVIINTTITEQIAYCHVTYE